MRKERSKQYVYIQHRKMRKCFGTLFILVISLLIRNLVLKDQDSVFLFLTSINIKTQTYIKKILHHNNRDTATLQFYLSDTEK